MLTSCPKGQKTVHHCRKQALTAIRISSCESCGAFSFHGVPVKGGDADVFDRAGTDQHIAYYKQSAMIFGYVRDLYQRHRNKFLAASGVAAVSYLISVYVRNKIKEFQEQLKEENATRDLIKKRFSQTQKDCYMTFLSFLPVLVEPIYKTLDVEEVTKELKLIRSRKVIPLSSESKSEIVSEDLMSTTTRGAEGAAKEQILGPVTGKSKVELWNELKNKSLTRFLTLIYSETLLIILLHLQLNIISRKSYLKTAIKLASKSQGIELIDLEEDERGFSNVKEEEKDLPEQAFLSFTWWLLNRGWVKLNDLISESVDSVFNEVNLRQELTVDEFANLIFEVQKSIDYKLFLSKEAHELYDSVNEGDADYVNNKVPVLLSLMLPSSNDEFDLLRNTNTAEFLATFNTNISNMEILQKMNAELKGYLRGPEVFEIVKSCASVGISSILTGLNEAVIMKQGNTIAPTNEEGLENATPEKKKLVLLLSVLTPQTHELANRNIGNPVLQAMNRVPGLEDLSASVYSNFDL